MNSREFEQRILRGADTVAGSKGILRRLSAGEQNQQNPSSGSSSGRSSGPRRGLKLKLIKDRDVPMYLPSQFLLIFSSLKLHVTLPQSFYLLQKNKKYLKSLAPRLALA